VQQPDVTAALDICPKLAVISVIVNYVLYIDPLIWLAAEGRSTLFFEKPFLRTSEDAVLVGSDFLQENLHLDEAGDIEDPEYTDGLIARYVLKVRRILGQSPVCIDRIRRKLVQTPLLLEVTVPWQRCFDIENVKQGSEPKSRGEYPAQVKPS